MSGLVRRLRGLVAQSRIRLERAPLGPERVQTGDLIEVEARLWRVAAAVGEEQKEGRGFELVPAYGPPAKAFLVGPATADAGGERCWTLVYGELRLRVPARDVLGFAADSEAGSTACNSC